MLPKKIRNQKNKKRVRRDYSPMHMLSDLPLLWNALWGVAIAAVLLFIFSDPLRLFTSASMGDATPGLPLLTAKSSGVSSSQETTAAAEKMDAFVETLLTDKRAGTTFTATALPSSARLTIYSRQSGAVTEECSGAFVSQRAVLTAAHCVCGDAADYEACTLKLADVGVEVFSPVGGLYQANASPRVHEKYRKPASVIHGKTSLADLAVVYLDRPAPVLPASLPAAPLAGDRYAIVSFGSGAWASERDGWPIRAGDTFQAGIQQYSVQKQVSLTWEHCGNDGASVDAYCSQYSPIKMTSGPYLDAAVCPGDSGSGLYALGSEAAPVLAGITSYYYPAYDGAACDTTTPRTSYFIATQVYADWIRAAAAPDASKASAANNTPSIDVRACRELVISGPANAEFKSLGYLSTSEVGINGVKAAMRDQINVACNRSRTGQSYWCLTSQTVKIIKQDATLTQVVTCPRAPSSSSP